MPRQRPVPAKKVEKVSDLIQNEFRYLVDYEYDSYSCYGCYGCDGGDDYCRGARYEGLRASSVDMARVSEHIAKTIGITDPLDKYSLDRVLRSLYMYDPTRYTVESEGGYYGDEVGSITYDGMDALREAVDQFLYLRTSGERFRYALLCEYGQVPIRYQAMTPTIKTLSVAEVRQANSHQTLRKKERDSVYSNYQGIMGVVLPDLKLIDGHHRTFQTKAKTADFIVLE